MVPYCIIALGLGLCLSSWFMDGDYILLGYTTNKFYDLQGCVIVYILYSVVLPLGDGSTQWQFSN